MSDITIPPEAVEAAARAAYAEWVGYCVTSGGYEGEYRKWDELDEEEREAWRNHATETLRAALNAWPGVRISILFPPNGPHVVLPLPADTINKETENG